jgi:uncharacterized membrane protein YccC
MPDPVPRPPAIAWIKAKDPGLLALKRSARAAVVVPAAFALCDQLFSNPQIGLFGAFGSFSLLLLVDFPGRARVRFLSYAGLFVAGAAFIALGTLVSTHEVAAVVTMALVGFGVLFAGCVSPQAATGATAALLLFVLPVAVAQPVSATGPRLLGWVIAGAISIPACLLVWPTPWHDDLRRHLSSTVSAIGRLVGTAGQGGAAWSDAETVVHSELSALRKQYQGTPYPPTGAAGGAVALAKLVGRVQWAAGNAASVGSAEWSVDHAEARRVVDAVAETLERCGVLVCDGHGYPVDDPVSVGALEESSGRLDELVTSALESEVATLIGPGPDAAPVAAVDGAGSPAKGGTGEVDDELVGIAGSLDPSFRVRALGIATEMVADATLEAAGAQGVGDRRLGPPGDAPARAIWPRLASNLSSRSVWFRNSVRGAVGLALAVAVVEITDVEHGFWVVLGTLSVLRSNALGTGATALRAVGGTTVGFVVGSAIMLGVGGHTALLWALLPPAVLLAGAAPSIISFAAGQAGFTVVVVILFNIIDPTGWEVGLTRIEDVAIGCGVSIVVGLLFWPRGATAALGRALSEAFVESSGYLADAVERLTVSTRRVDTGPGQRASHRAYLRLDDAFRQFLAERGAKLVPVDTVAQLLTGANRLRLAAFTLTTLPAPTEGPDSPELESMAIAGAVLRDSYAASHRWYQEFAELLADHRTSLDPPPIHDRILHDVLRAAFEDARSRRRGDRLQSILHMLWADELLEGQSQIQSDLADSADLFSRQRHKGVLV